MRRQDAQIFIIKVWKEKNEEKNWRGQIQNVCTGQSISVSNLNELVCLIRRYFDQGTKIYTKQERGLK